MPLARVGSRSRFFEKHAVGRTLNRLERVSPRGEVKARPASHADTRAAGDDAVMPRAANAAGGGIVSAALNDTNSACLPSRGAGAFRADRAPLPSTHAILPRLTSARLPLLFPPFLPPQMSPRLSFRSSSAFATSTSSPPSSSAASATRWTRAWTTSDATPPSAPSPRAGRAPTTPPRRDRDVRPSRRTAVRRHRGREGGPRAASLRPRRSAHRAIGQGPAHTTPPWRSARRRRRRRVDRAARAQGPGPTIDIPLRR